MATFLMDPTSLRRPKFRGPHFEKMRFAVVFLAFFVTLDLASSLTLDQPPSLRPSISSFAISSPAGVRQVNGPDQKHRPPSASRISSIRGGSSGLLASAGGILTSAAVVGASNLFGFAFTVATGSQKATDLVGTGCFAVSAIATLVKGGAAQAGGRAAISTSLITAWSTRLASFLFYRIWMIPEDNRLSKVFATLTGTAGFWFASFLWGFIVLLPHSMSSFATTQAPMGLDGAIFTGSALLGFIVESVADWQKWCFKRSPEYNEKWCDKGLWRYSRHPNYAGEQIFWWSIYALSAPTLASSDKPWRLALGALSPLFISTLLLFVSGVNLAEARNDEKYGALAEYQAYKSKTPLLFPFF